MVECDALYAQAHAARVLDHRLEPPACSGPGAPAAQPPRFAASLDLHRFVGSVARAAVRYVLAGLRRAPSSASEDSSPGPASDLEVVTGQRPRGEVPVGVDATRHGGDDHPLTTL